MAAGCFVADMLTADAVRMVVVEFAHRGWVLKNVRFVITPMSNYSRTVLLLLIYTYVFAKCDVY